ncbi:hypothetical protein K9M48_00185 [Candidatus Gracilibacteria bacterium]|nr:hypothetical protein [Candidatus Gracilibacteria bacterium]
MEDLNRYINPDYKNLMNYTDFQESSTSFESEEEIIVKIKLLVNKEIGDILFINIKEDKIFLNEKEKNKLPKFIQNMLRFSEHRGIKIYIFKYKNNENIRKQAVGVFGGSMGRGNEFIFEQIINDPEIKDIVKKTEINLSDLLKNNGKI